MGYILEYIWGYKLGLLVRKGWYYFYKRVPEYIKEYDSRTFVRIALKTKDRLEAQKKAVVYEEEYNKLWESLIQGDRKALDADYKKANALCKLHGFAYKNAIELAKSSTKEELFERISAARMNLLENASKKAILGMIDTPAFPLSQCLNQFWDNCADRFVNKSDHQIRKYKNPRIRSFNEFIKVIGDKDLHQIERKDILDFHRWLMEQIAKGKNADTANKKMRHVKDILRTVSNANEIPFDEDVLFARIRFKLDTKSRPPFEANYVQETLLPSLNGLNEDARMLVYAMADTGARESELVGLDKSDIFLNGEVPYIWIRAKEKRSLKTKHSDRQIPLVGTALYAFQKMPNGFTRYKEADSISGLINKYFTNNNLRPTKEHSLYSLRHTFKDRLRDIQAPEEIIDQLMGHKIDKPRYGRGHLLKTSHEWLQKIAFTPPENNK